MSSESTDSSYSKQHSKKDQKKDHKKDHKKESKYPHLAGEWQWVRQRVRYTVRPDGTIIPADIYHPDTRAFDVIIKQNGAFIEFDIPISTGPPRLGVISGKKGDWDLRIVETNDNAFFTAHIKKTCPKKFELVATESGFACPPPAGDPLPCQLDQTPTVSIGQLIRKRDRWA